MMEDSNANANAGGTTKARGRTKTLVQDVGTAISSALLPWKISMVQLPQHYGQGQLQQPFPWRTIIPPVRAIPTLIPASQTPKILTPLFPPPPPIMSKLEWWKNGFGQSQDPAQPQSVQNAGQVQGHPYSGISTVEGEDSPYFKTCPAQQSLGEHGRFSKAFPSPSPITMRVSSTMKAITGPIPTPTANAEPLSTSTTMPKPIPMHPLVEAYLTSRSFRRNRRSSYKREKDEEKVPVPVGDNDKSKPEQKKGRKVKDHPNMTACYEVDGTADYLRYLKEKNLTLRRSKKMRKMLKILRKKSGKVTTKEPPPQPFPIPEPGPEKKMMEHGEERNGISKIRDLIRRQRQESDGGCGGYGEDSSSELEFDYMDADTYPNEISELYSYTEVPEFKRNLTSYETLLTRWGIPLQWQRLTPDLRKSAILRLQNMLELSNKSLRGEAARALLYIVQGCWNEVQSDKEQQQWTRYNVCELIKYAIFPVLVDVLSLEMECGPMAIRKPAVSLADSADLRVVLNIMYTIVETVRCRCQDDPWELVELRASFVHELRQPFREELLACKLLNMVIKFCGGSAPHFPIRKVLLLLWKVILVTLGGTQELRELKKEYRDFASLPNLREDTIEVSKTMRAASPPASAADLLDAQNERRSQRPLRRSLMKQSSLDETAALEFELNDQVEDEMKEIEERRAMEESGQLPQPPSPRPMTPLPHKNKGLPWTPKVRQKDLDAFLEASRVKFVGFPIHGDRDTLAGLPAPIHEGVKVLKQHVYISLSEWQVQKEEELARCPLSMGEKEAEFPKSEVENLYAAILPSLNQYIIALLKILLAAAPTSKSKSESINIMADVLPEEMPMTVVQSMKLGIDVARHKEIIVKSISAIIILLLKHTKVNHIYQFEFISQHLVFANCIPLVLKFFNQNITAYITAKNTIALTDFPSCVLGEPPELTPESLELGEPQPFCWRNLFACINLLRILNKLTKWKHSRIMMLVVFKSAPILKRSLRVKHPLLQLYILKLLKMQTKYLGRQWRKANMKTMSAIYQKVRHRLTDDWAYGNDLDARPWDFQAEECALRAAVDRFNNRRYGDATKNLPEFEPIDKCATSVLGRPMQLTTTFKDNYEVWLEQEVFKNPVDWDEILKHTGVM